MDFILAHSRYIKHKFTEAIEICDKLLQKNNKDQAAWVLKCQCLIKQNYIDQLQTEEDGIAQMLINDQQSNKLARVGTSFKNNNNANPIMRPLNSGRLNTGFQRIGTSVASRSGTRSSNMLRTGKIMTRGGVPTTSNGRVLRLSTASLQQHGQNFFDSSKVDLRKIAQRKSKARLVFQYLFFVEHNLKKALQLAIYATENNNFQDPWWKLALGKCYYHLTFYPQAQKQFLSSIKHNNNIQSYLYLSKIYQKQDNVQKSIQILEKCQKINPFELKSNIAIGRIYIQLNDLQRSHVEYMKVLSLQNSNIQAVASIASNYFYKDQVQIALKLYQRLVQLGYDSSEVWNNLAICSFGNQQLDTYSSCFQRAILLSKDQQDPMILTDIWYNIGYTFAVLGEIDISLQAFKISLDYIPENVESLNNIGVIQSRKKGAEQAIPYCQKSFKEIPNFEAAFNLSIWYLETNNFERSHFYNKQALKLYQNHAQSLQLQSRLLKKLDRL